jgi:hypothetical protein
MCAPQLRFYSLSFHILHAPDHVLRYTNSAEVDQTSVYCADRGARPVRRLVMTAEISAEVQPQIPLVLMYFKVAEDRGIGPPGPPGVVHTAHPAHRHHPA